MRTALVRDRHEEMRLSSLPPRCATNAQQTAHDQEAIAAERRAPATEETRRTALEAQIAEKERKREERIIERAEALAAKLAWSLFFAAATALGLASFVASDVLLPRAVTSLVPVLVFLAILTVTLFSIINGIFGTNLDDLRKRLQRLLVEGDGSEASLDRHDYPSPSGGFTGPYSASNSASVAGSWPKRSMMA